MRVPTPVANGIRTDHPVPGLPFVDDALLDLNDPDAIEKIGRNRGDGMWGRTDLYNMVSGAWRAFTTDPTNNDYAWVVTHHPENGTSVLLYADDDAVNAYSYKDFENKGVIPLIVRAGGYWSDGSTWRRPTALRDPVTSEFFWDQPQNARSLTAEEALAITTGATERQKVHSLSEVARGNAPVESYPAWVSHSLTFWAGQRPEGSLALGKCILDIQAPELEQGALLDNTQAAEMAGVETSTWRAYVSRGTAPEPQVGSLGKNRSRWSLPIIEAWAAKRERDESGRSLIEPDDRTTSVVDRIRSSVVRLGRRVAKAGGGTEAVRGALQGKILGIALYGHTSAAMHAAWMVEEFDPKSDSVGFPGLPNQVVDQIISLAWFDPYVAENAIREYVAKGLERGYDRLGLEKALTLGQGNLPEYLALVQRAVKPHWD